jgi:hypothetical protein
MARGKEKKHKQQKPKLFEIIRTQFSHQMNPGYPITPEKQDSDLKALPMMLMIEDMKKDIDNSLEEMQENAGKHIEALKKETQKFP